MTDTEAQLAKLRELCMALPEVREGLTHGAPTWFVGRRSFVKFVDPEHPRVPETFASFWAAAPPGALEELIAADPERFFKPRFGGYHWVGMRLNGNPDWEEVREVVTDGYRRVATQRLLAQMGD